MPSTSLLQALKRDFPTVSFTPGGNFHWSPKEGTITYLEPLDEATLLHEVAHMILDHSHYTRDIELLKMERDAWDYAASSLSNKYNVFIPTDKIETMLDSYRDWLHDRSLCPGCEATGIQTTQNTYKCLACSNSWRVNEARACALRRYKIK